jgi:hypothetical protein
MAAPDWWSRGSATASAVAFIAVALTCGLAAQEPDLDELLARAAAWVARYERELGALVAEERYNIGPIARTGIVPTLALTVVRADYQARFAMRMDDDRERVDGRDAVVVAYD